MVHPFGLDLSDSLIRLAVLDRTRRGWRLSVRGEIPVPPGFIVDGEIHKPDDVARLLEQLLAVARPKTRQTVVSLPERHTFLKLLTLKTAKARDLTEEIKSAAGQHLPYTWEEIYYDWSVIPEKNSLGQTEVLIAAAPRTLVDAYLNVLTGIGLEPVSCEIESLAIARATLTKNQLRQTYILLDLGRTRSTLMLAQQGIIRFSTTVRYAGHDLNRFIAAELNITEQQAEKAKSLFGLDPHRGQGLLRRVLTPHIEALAAKVTEAEEFYAEHGENQQPIAGVLVTGSGALLRGIAEELTARLHHPVRLQPIWILPDLQRLDHHLAPEIGYTYADVIGLALQTWPR